MNSPVEGRAGVTVDVFGLPINALDWQEAIHFLQTWSDARSSRVVCICNAHSLVQAVRDSEFRDALRFADLATPDGAPVAFMVRRLGFSLQERINGPDLMLRYCAEAAKSSRSVFLYGGSPETLEKLKENLRRMFPRLEIAGAISPPFRALTEVEDEAIVQAINESGAGVVWVGLGCPKQEIWMHSHRNRVHAAMVGVGAAFDYHAGTVRRAPVWMQRRGLEWFFRLLSEPRRLWRRYLFTNTMFFVLACRQLATDRRGRTRCSQ